MSTSEIRTSCHFNPRGDPSITGRYEVFSAIVDAWYGYSTSLLQRICSYHNTFYSPLYGTIPCNDNAPSGVQEKHFPLISLHSASGKVPFSSSCDLILHTTSIFLNSFYYGFATFNASTCFQSPQ